MYKLTRPNGKDFYSDTVDYGGSIGKIIRVTDYSPPEAGICGKGLHASKNPNDCLIVADIPCRAFEVKGINKIAGDSTKGRYKALKIIEEIHDLDKLFGWNYSEVINPIHPFKIKPPKKITDEHKQLVQQWDSVRSSVRDPMGGSMWASMWASMRDSVWDSKGNYVRASIWDSVWDSVWDSMASVWASVWASVRASVWDSMWDYVWDSMRDYVEDSVWDYVRASVRDFMGAYTGSLFPNVKKWKHIDHKEGEYPFQPAVDLWRQGLVPSYDGETWRLHGGPKGKVLAKFKF